MTVPATARRAGPFTGNGVTIAFPFTFKVFAAADLQVDIATATGIASVGVLGSDYTVTLNPDQTVSPGGTVSFAVSGVATPLPTGYLLAVTGNRALAQTTTLPTGGSYQAAAVEAALDSLEMQIQQIDDGLARSLTLSPLAPTGTNTELPAPESNKLIGWDASANALQNVDPTTLASVVAFGTANADQFTGNGTTTAFTLSANPAALNNLDVSIGGVVQRPTTDYTWASGTTITFTSAPPNGAAILVRYMQALPQGSADSAAVGYAGRTVKARLDEMRSVMDDIGSGVPATDGVTSSQAALVAAVAAAAAGGYPLYWPDYDFVSTASIPSFHSVRHWGPGRVKRGAYTYAVEMGRADTRQLYVAPAGSATNDGITPTEPLTIQGAVDALSFAGPIKGRQQIIGAGGVYNESVFVPRGLAMNPNYLEFKFPSDPGVRGDPAAWPGGGAVLDGTFADATSVHGFEVGSFNNVYVEYLLLRDWYNTSLASTSQVKRALHVNEYAFCFALGCSFTGNGLSNISADPLGYAYVTGGILDGARYGCDNTGGRLTMTSTAGVNYTTIKNALEYGIYAKHNSSTVLDNTEFLDNGQVAAAATYGAALFAYKSGTSIDTRNCTFKRNNIVYNIRGGHIAANPSLPDVFGSGADANDRIWLIRGYGADDLLNYQSKAPRELSLSNGGNSTTSTTVVQIFNTSGTVKAGYLTQADAHIEIEVFCNNAAGGTAQLEPSFVSASTSTRYSLGSWQIAAATFAHLRIIVQPITGGATASMWWTANGATVAGATSGVTSSFSIPFNTDDLIMQVWGSAAAGTLTIRKTRCILWG